MVENIETSYREIDTFTYIQDIFTNIFCTVMGHIIAQKEHFKSVIQAVFELWNSRNTGNSESCEECTLLAEDSFKTTANEHFCLHLM